MKVVQIGLACALLLSFASCKQRSDQGNSAVKDVNRRPSSIIMTKVREGKPQAVSVDILDVVAEQSNDIQLVRAGLSFRGGCTAEGVPVIEPELTQALGGRMIKGPESVDGAAQDIPSWYPTEWWVVFRERTRDAYTISTKSGSGFLWWLGLSKGTTKTETIQDKWAMTLLSMPSKNAIEMTRVQDRLKAGFHIVSYRVYIGAGFKSAFGCEPNREAAWGSYLASITVAKDGQSAETIVLDSDPRSWQAVQPK